VSRYCRTSEASEARNPSPARQEQLHEEGTPPEPSLVAAAPGCTKRRARPRPAQQEHTWALAGSNSSRLHEEALSRVHHLTCTTQSEVEVNLRFFFMK
jgi:hypothetical protein